MAIEHFQRSIRVSPLDPYNFNALIGIGAAHFLAGRYEAAADWVQKGIAERPQAVWALRLFVAACWNAGRHDEAREALKLLRNADPEVSVSSVADAVSFTAPQYREPLLEGLRQAGLPEE